MLNIVSSTKFKKDLKRTAKRGYNINLLEEVVTMLANEEELPAKYHDHQLTGSYEGFRECHIQPDWLLIYRVDGEDLMLFLSRTGSHSNLF